MQLHKVLLDETKHILQTLWLDPRGTGLSTPVSADTLPSRLKSDQDIADYLKYFRADSIGKLSCLAI